MKRKNCARCKVQPTVATTLRGYWIWCPKCNVSTELGNAFTEDDANGQWNKLVDRYMQEPLLHRILEKIIRRVLK